MYAAVASSKREPQFSQCSGVSQKKYPIKFKYATMVIRMALRVQMTVIWPKSMYRYTMVSS